MKKKFLLFAMVAVLVLTMVLLYGCQQTGASVGLSSSQQTGIWVTGEGKVTVAPDVVNIQLGIQSQAKAVADAQTQASQAMNAVMSSLTDNGVAQKDIQTQYYNIQQLTRWDNDTQEQVITGYQVTNLVNAKIRDVAKAGTIIDAATQAGGDLTRVNSIQFSVDDPTVYYDQAREKAMADANDTATQLAKQADVKLGKAIYISETNVSTPRTISVYAKGTAEDASVTTPISAGEMEINLTVQVTYAIR
ncbi:MAG: SIMPL domain-containing protein [Dehalococcoidales bacterium]|nr:SIMPL domain-containing protein [Dehalococcoidales bacterium]